MRILGLLFMVLFISFTSAAQEKKTSNARQGFYFDFTFGNNQHFGFDSSNVTNNFPYGVSSKAHSTFLNELDFGYCFKNNFSLALGFEFNNFVDVGYKMDIKQSFRKGQTIQPYAYMCIHGGITDLAVMSGHLGFGIDYFFADRAYFMIDARCGPSWESADLPADPITNRPPLEFHMEAAMSFGLGFQLTKKQ